MLKENVLYLLRELVEKINISVIDHPKGSFMEVDLQAFILEAGG
jgi:hypothetical protein